MMLLVLSTKRILRKWRGPCMLMVAVIILWLASFSISKLVSPAQDIINKHQVSSKLEHVIDLEKSRFVSGDVNPIPIRRGPVSFGRNLGEEALVDEENVAKEMVDSPKEKNIIHQNKLDIIDENAALEEHSAENEKSKVISRQKSSETISKEKRKLISELEEQEESFHQLPEFPLENPIENENMKNMQDINWIANINPKQKFESHLLVNNKSKTVHKLPDQEQELQENKSWSKKKNINSKEKAEQEESFHQLPEHQKDLPEDRYGSYNNWRNFTVSEIKKLSVLGRRLFLNEKNSQGLNKIFTIHVWKHKKYIAKRLLKESSVKGFNPFDECSVNNCRLTFKDSDVKKADAVLFHLHRLAGPPSDIPRSAQQLWVWLSDESPYNVFMVSRDKNLAHYNGFFNWSMTYRVDADVPVPYGRTVPLPKDQYLEVTEDVFNLKEKDIAVLGSNCGGSNHRYKYIKKLQKYIPVDIYGRCGKLKCPGHFNNDCKLLDDYKFYLAFENSNCDDYITEKVRY